MIYGSNYIYNINENEFKSLKNMTDEEILDSVKKEYNDIDNNSHKFIKWFCHVLNILCTISYTGIIFYPLVRYICDASNRFFAMPGSLADKINDCENFSKSCNRYLSKIKDPKVRKEVEKLKRQSDDKLNELLVKEKNAGGMPVSVRMQVENNNVICNTTNSPYIYASLYEDYIQNKISNEEAIAYHLQQYIPINEIAYKNIRAINESKIKDKIKTKWEKFLAFIRNIFAKFMEAMTNLFSNDKEYLEKYKDIILTKKPKKGNKVSMPGNYEEAIKRCINVKVPIFDYDSYSKDLMQGESNDYEAIVKSLMGSHGFVYDKGKELKEQFKSYFLASTDNQINKEFSQLNFTNMYNFCYNSKQIEDIKKKDEDYLNQSTTKIQNAIATKIRERENANESFYSNRGTYITEEDNNNTNTNTNAISQTSTYADDTKKLVISTDDAEKQVNNQTIDTNGKNAEESVSDLEKMVSKWNTVCGTIITAKCTALQQIYKDYMAIIRTHVRSYVGNTKDTNDDKKADKATDYGKK